MFSLILPYINNFRNEMSEQAEQPNAQLHRNVTFLEKRIKNHNMNITDRQEQFKGVILIKQKTFIRQLLKCLINKMKQAETPL